MPDRAVSKSQFRLFKGIAEGNLDPRGGLTQHKAAEMVGHQSPKGLPERKAAKKKRRKKVNTLPYPKR